MASAGGRSSAALAGSQVVGATLSLKGRSREGGFPGGGDLGEVDNLKRRGGGRLLGITVAGQGGDEGVMGGGIREIETSSERVVVVEVAGGEIAMGWDLLDGSGVEDLGLRKRERSSSEASVAEAAPAKERNNLFELGDGGIGGGAAVGGEIGGRIGSGIGGLSRGG